MQNLAQKIESILFWKGEPLTLKRLAEMCGEKPEAVAAALDTLESELASRGIVLMRTDKEVALGSSPETAGLIEKLSKEELERDLGRAGLETLSIILYYGPVARRDIDYIRGVNSAFILRSLVVRGLVEREQNEKDQRSFVYKPSMELLSFLGLKKVSDLPEFEAVKQELAAFKESSENEDNMKDKNENGQ